MRVTSKGQVTIPIIIRDKLGLAARSEVEFRVLSDGKVCLTKVDEHQAARRTREEDERQGDYRLSTDEIMKLTRG